MKGFSGGRVVDASVFAKGLLAGASGVEKGLDEVGKAGVVAAGITVAGVVGIVTGTVGAGEGVGVGVGSELGGLTAGGFTSVSSPVNGFCTGAAVPSAVTLVVVKGFAAAGNCSGTRGRQNGAKKR